MVRRPGRRLASAWWTAATAPSSPGWVLAAIQTGRPATRPDRCARARASGGGGGGAGGGGRGFNFKVPPPAPPHRAEPHQPLGVRRALGDAQRVAFEKR